MVFYSWIKCSLPSGKGQRGQTGSLKACPRIRYEDQKRVGGKVSGVQWPLRHRPLQGRASFLFVLVLGSKCTRWIDRSFVHRRIHTEALFCLCLTLPLRKAVSPPAGTMRAPKQLCSRALMVSKFRKVSPKVATASNALNAAAYKKRSDR